MTDLLLELPLWRGKDMETNEWVIGYLTPLFPGDGEDVEYTIYPRLENDEGFDSDNYSMMNIVGLEQGHSVDRKTLGLHLPNMVDKNKGRVFASYGVHGNGGDKVKVQLVDDLLGGVEDYDGYVVFNMHGAAIIVPGIQQRFAFGSNIEVIGIYEKDNL